MISSMELISFHKLQVKCLCHFALDDWTQNRTWTPFPRPWPQAGGIARSSCSGAWGSLWFLDPLVANWLSCWVGRRPVGCCSAGAREGGQRSYRDRPALCVSAGRVVRPTHATSSRKAPPSSTPSSSPCTRPGSLCSWRHGSLGIADHQKRELLAAAHVCPTRRVILCLLFFPPVHCSPLKAMVLFGSSCQKSPVSSRLKTSSAENCLS